MVAADYEEGRVFKVFFGVLDAACGAQLYFLADLGDVDAEERAVAECVLYLLAFVSDCNYNVVESEIGEVRDQMLYRRDVYYRNTGFGSFKCQGTKSCAFAAAHYAYFHVIDFWLLFLLIQLLRGIVARRRHETCRKNIIILRD